MRKNVYHSDGRKLYTWIAWGKSGRIVDCGIAWAHDASAASVIASTCLGGPFRSDFDRLETREVTE